MKGGVAGGIWGKQSKPNMNVGLGLSRSNVPSVEINFHPQNQRYRSGGAEFIFYGGVKEAFRPILRFSDLAYFLSGVSYLYHLWTQRVSVMLVGNAIIG